MEIIFRGKGTDDKWYEGSLVTTTSFLIHKPKCHTKHWIIMSSFGNGGWFNIRRRRYVKEDTIEELYKTDFNGVKIWKKRDVSHKTNRRYR